MLKNITIILAGASLIFSCANTSEPTSTPSEKTVEADGIIPVNDANISQSSWSEIDFQKQGIYENMAYADTANFIGQKIYPCPRCFLRPEAASALIQANKIAKLKGLRLMLFDVTDLKNISKLCLILLKILDT